MPAAATAPIAHAIVIRLVVSTNPNETISSNTKNSIASLEVISPVAKGLSAVRLTCLSSFWSARSFTTQPAERVSSVPSENTIRRCNDGMPPAAIQSAASVGQSNSRDPMGRSNLAAFSNAGHFEWSRIDRFNAMMRKQPGRKSVSIRSFIGVCSECCLPVTVKPMSEVI